MPVYVYICPKCNREVEITRSYDLGDIVPPRCEHCGVEMFRSWNDTPVHFKGRGFYANDSKKETDR